ncbi:hypothetical protein [Verrucomicrobium spinosum]|uniref:hypothetical protein n=1 Tax=Verrucomicrobium spinosum TaxID=2736 RepID=UPI000B15B923|nr:hypothetical protein [Verrucomicrobium spinosum]
MKSPFLLTLCAALATTLVALPSCSKKQAPPTVGNEEATTTPPAYKALADVPEADRTALDAFAKKLEQDLKDGNAAGVKAAFNLKGIISKILSGVQTSGPDMDKFRLGLNQGLRQNLDHLVKTWAEQQVTYKHLVIHEGMPKPRFRFSSDTMGTILLDFTVEKDSEGKLGIVDFYNQVLGSGMVEQSRQAALPALAEMDKSFMKRLFDKPNTKLEDIEKFGKLSDKFRQQDHKGVVEVYNSMPTEMKSNITANAMYLGALQAAGIWRATRRLYRPLQTNTPLPTSSSSWWIFTTWRKTMTRPSSAWMDSWQRWNKTRNSSRGRVNFRWPKANPPLQPPRSAKPWPWSRRTPRSMPRGWMSSWPPRTLRQRPPA